MSASVESKALHVKQRQREHTYHIITSAVLNCTHTVKYILPV